MSSTGAQSIPLWPLAVYFVLVLAMAAVIIVLSYLLGERHHDRAKNDIYESGMLPTGSARLRFPAEFYLIAMFFVIFDLETAFVVAWAVSMRQLGWAGYVEIVIFIGVLVASLIYLWRTGALDWSTTRQVAQERTLEKEQDHRADS
ncbi:MAG: NADH-quinone oxidoreductase subunit A [Armatimonadota bacterium]